MENITTDSFERIPEREVKWKLLLNEKEDDNHLRDWSKSDGVGVYYKVDYSEYEAYVSYVRSALQSSEGHNSSSSSASIASGKTTKSSNSAKLSHPSAQLALKMRECVPQTDPNTVIPFEKYKCFPYDFDIEKEGGETNHCKNSSWRS